MTERDQLGADDIERYFSLGVEAHRKISDVPKVLLVIDPRIDSIAMRTPVLGAPPQIEGLHRITLDVEQDVGDDELWYVLRLDATDAHYEAYLLIASIVDLMIDGAELARAVDDAVAAFRDLLTLRARLSVEQQVGLFGELLLLEHCLKTVEPAAALDAWLGAYGEEHDFSFETFDVEVKTTRSESRIHTIGSETQLEATPGRPLYLHSIQITAAGAALGGRRLAEVVESVESLVGAPNRSRLEAGLREARWRVEDAPLYPVRYVLRSTPAVYLVDEEFPAITRGRLVTAVPNAGMVGRVSYRLDVTHAVPSPAPFPIDAFCQETTP